MQAVATEARASKETLYGWFNDRDGLLEALVAGNADETAAGVTAALAEPAQDEGGARATLVAYTETLLDLLTGPVSVALNRVAMTSPRLAAVLLASGRHRAGPVVEAYLASLHEQGISPHSDPAAAFSMLYGLTVQDTQIRVLLGEQPPTPAHRRARAEQAVEIFLHRAG